MTGAGSELHIRDVRDGDLGAVHVINESAVPHVNSVSRDRDRWVVQGDGPVLAHVGAALVKAGAEPIDLRAERPTLEDVFLSLTDVEASG